MQGNMRFVLFGPLDNTILTVYLFGLWTAAICSLVCCL
jgi:hypothetical protein